MISGLRHFVGRVVTAVLVGLVVFYQGMIRPLLGGGCRYCPTCSVYAIDALRTHGPTRGLWLAVRRLGRCHGWSAGGFDPVPPRADGPR